MALVPFSFPVSSSPSMGLGTLGGRLHNVFLRDGMYCPSCGFAPWINCKGIFRGGIVVANYFYAVLGHSLYRMNLEDREAFERMDVQVNGDEPVFFARNRNSTPAIVLINRDVHLQVVDGKVTDYSAAGAPNSVRYLDGYFLFTYTDGRIAASELNDTTINDQSYTYTESNTSPLIRGCVKNRLFIAFKQSGAEFYIDVGASPFPLQRVEVSSTGLLAPHALAGDIEGWDKPLFFVADDGTVRMVQGYQFPVVSTQAVQDAIAEVGDPEQLRAFVYTAKGNSFFVLRSPDWCWEYHLEGQAWIERHSLNSSTWRAIGSIKIGQNWIIGDEEGSGLYRIDADSRKEGDGVVPCTAEGVVQTFPEGMIADDLRIYVRTGLQKQTMRDPPAELRISWSDDGGIQFCEPRVLNLGRTGKYTNRLRMSTLGSVHDHGLVLRWQVLDPIPFAFLSAGIVKGK